MTISQEMRKAHLSSSLILCLWGFWEHQKDQGSVRLIFHKKEKKVQSLSCVQFFGTPWIVDNKAPLSIGFSRQVYWSGLPFPAPGGLPHPWVKSESPVSPAFAGGFFTTEPPGKPSCLVLLYFSRYYIVRLKMFLFFCVFPIYYLCEKYYKPISVQYYIAKC